MKGLSLCCSDTQSLVLEVLLDEDVDDGTRVDDVEREEMDPVVDPVWCMGPSLLCTTLGIGL